MKELFVWMLSMAQWLIQCLLSCSRLLLCLVDAIFVYYQLCKHWNPFVETMHHDASSGQKHDTPYHIFCLCRNSYSVRDDWTAISEIFDSRYVNIHQQFWRISSTLDLVKLTSGLTQRYAKILPYWRREGRKRSNNMVTYCAMLFDRSSLRSTVLQIPLISTWQENIGYHVRVMKYIILQICGNSTNKKMRHLLLWTHTTENITAPTQP